MTHMPLSQRCLAIELLLLDVDGVLTDGGIIYGDDGREWKVFHVRDGSGLKLWHLAGKRSAVISGRSSTVVDVRAAELGVSLVLQGAADKRPAYQRVLTEMGVRSEQVCYIADDVPDLPILRDCGLAVAVADACPEVRSAADYITLTPGGRGAVRETVELILRCQNRWPSF
ncbi:MAG TPA: HAD hydrolase family protein [Gemmataceae bacterium]|nr:HAD hydrolase family protein [Gemmataceae bacterium]